MAVHGKNTYIAIDDADGDLTDISDIGTESGLSRSLDTADASHFGSQAKEYVAGQDDATGTVSGLFTPAQDAMLNAAFEALISGARPSLTFRYGPAGSTLNQPYYEQEVIITSYEVTGSVGDLVTANLSLQRTGPTTRGSFVA